MKALIISFAMVGTFFAGTTTNRILDLVTGDPSKVGATPGIFVTISVGCILISVIGSILESKETKKN